MTTPVRINPAIFREYDIRGIVDQDLNDAVLESIGRAFGTFLYSHPGLERRTCVVGRDVRETSEHFMRCLITGLHEAGVDVIDIGIVPTPVVYFSVARRQVDGGVVVTASHNPPEFNGLKLRKRGLSGSDPLTSAEVQQVRAIAQAGVFHPGAGKTELHLEMLDDYIAYVSERTKLHRRLKVVLDAGNGVTGPSTSEIFRRIGCDLIGMYLEPDGRFPNHVPNPIQAENMRDLQARVKAEKADVGIATDGDGDRLGVVDDQGNIVWADEYLILLARQALQRGPAPIVFDVKCSLALQEDIVAHGGTPVMSKTGYPNVMAARRANNAALAGEFSGHIFLDDPIISFDDGTFAGAKLLQYLSSIHKPLSAALAEAPKYYATPEIRIDCPEDQKFGLIAELREDYRREHEVIDIDGVRVVYPDGWALVRASNTEPSLTARFEAKTPERLQEIMADARQRLSRYDYLHPEF